jgi:hypothetical protein
VNANESPAIDGTRNVRDPGPGGDDTNADEPSDEHADEATPTFVDQYGNPVDEETAKALLEQMQRDASESVRGRGRGRGKKHKPKDN